jgi:hypothetical protein
MNKISKYIFSLLPLWGLGGLLLLGACSDFLDIEPNDRITGEKFYQTEEDFQAATAPLYNKVWFDFNDKFYYGLGDGRAYNLYAPYSDYVYPFADLLETGLTGPLVSAWASFYTVIQQSNRVIIGVSGSAVDDDIKKPYIAEARFMRGTAYWYLASLWGNVIISEDPSVLVAHPVSNTNPCNDVFEFAMRDLEYAALYLPETAPQAGRLTRYSAYGMLSRVYLSFAGLAGGTNYDKATRDEHYLDLAKKAADVVITKSSYKLLPKYEDLFKIENNNNTESMFALQWVPNSDYGTTNTQQAYFACGSEITGDDAAWGYWTRASNDILLQYDPQDLRRKATWMGYGDKYEEIDKAHGGFLYEKTREALNVKKGVVGSTKDNPAITRMNSSLNSYMMRLAEVYLIYAEATLGNNLATSDAKSLEYVNAIRKRAGLNPLTVLTYNDIAKERRLELCMEGQTWYDMVRRAYYQREEVLADIVTQSRGSIEPFLYSNGTFTAYPDPDRQTATRAIGIIDAHIFLLPYPESEVIQNPLLREPPVPFTFTEEKIAETKLFN